MLQVIFRERYGASRAPERAADRSAVVERMHHQLFAELSSAYILVAKISSVPVLISLRWLMDSDEAKLLLIRRRNSPTMTINARIESLDPKYYFKIIMHPSSGWERGTLSGCFENADDYCGVRIAVHLSSTSAQRALDPGLVRLLGWAKRAGDVS